MGSMKNREICEEKYGTEDKTKKERNIIRWWFFSRKLKMQYSPSYRYNEEQKWNGRKWIKDAESKSKPLSKSVEERESDENRE
jgi:hypothetical protein